MLAAMPNFIAFLLFILIIYMLYYTGDIANLYFIYNVIIMR